MLIVLIILSIIIIILLFIVLILLLKKKNTKIDINSTLNSELNKSINSAISTISTPLVNEINHLNSDLNEKIGQLKQENDKIRSDNENTRTSLLNTINSNQQFVTKTLVENNDKSIGQVNSKLNELSASLKETLTDIRKENSEKIDNIQKEVSTKLDDAISNKLKSSFDNFIKQLDLVNQSIGQMKTLTTDVTQLKNVLTNVKTKGITGEIILGNLIKDVLTNSQYEENVITKKGSNDRVEFAIKLPGNVEGETVFLPVDSKFPTSRYQEILDGLDEGNKEKIEEARKLLKNEIVKFAKDISTKYIDEPNTTSFAIMFLPIEGLYAEVLNLNIVESLQREQRIIISGPTTFMALLNSLQIGFKTLAIQQKSVEIYKVLQEIRQEFDKYNQAIDSVISKFDATKKELDTLSTTRTKAMQRKLNKLDDYSETEFIENHN